MSIKYADLNALSHFKDKMKAEILDETYPVGSIYISTTNTNPSTFFGGTWVAFGTGKTLVGYDTNDNDFSTIENTGGEKQHTLTVDEMPMHRHDLQGYRNTTTDASGTDKRPRMYARGSGSGWDGGDSIKTTGGGQPHNNMQPYIVVRFWKRTA